MRSSNESTRSQLETLDAEPLRPTRLPDRRGSPAASFTPNSSARSVDQRTVRPAALRWSGDLDLQRVAVAPDDRGSSRAGLRMHPQDDGVLTGAVIEVRVRRTWAARMRHRERAGAGRTADGANPAAQERCRGSPTMAPCRSARSIPTSTSSRSRNECWRGGGHARSSKRPSGLRKGAEPWIFYEGPPTANGRPGLHHVWARVFKDLYPRFQTMRGHDVPRKGGWDCHGLPVEIEVEKELGLTNKHEIEAFGVAEFTQRCRDSVSRYVEDWAALTERSGVWIDTKDAYWTLSNEYIESVWWIIRQMWDKGLVYEGHRVTPVLPALRHGAREPRSRAGLPRRRRPLCVRALPDHLRRPDRSRPPRLDHHAVDAGLERRGRRRPRHRLRAAPRRRRPVATSCSRKRPSTATSARAWARSSPASPAATWSGGTTSDRSPTCRSTKPRRGSSSRTT